MRNKVGRPSSSVADKRLRRVAHNRFSNLLHKRIGKKQGMANFLGKQQWAIFVRAARCFGSHKFKAAFRNENMWCRGPLDSDEACRSRRVVRAMSRLECDHVYDVNHICTTWKAMLLTVQSQHSAHVSWNHGLDQTKLLALLFDSAHFVIFRCSDCHPRRPHYQYRLAMQDLSH